jgi:hypothetical protein
MFEKTHGKEYERNKAQISGRIQGISANRKNIQSVHQPHDAESRKKIFEPVFMGTARFKTYGLIELYQNIEGHQQAGQTKKRIKNAAPGKISEIMFLHGRNIKTCGRKAHENERIHIGGLDEPFSSGDIEIGMKKMKIYRKKIYNKKMICPADAKRRFFGLGVEGKKNVKVEKRSEDADGQKKEVSSGSGTSENRQRSKCEKADERQEWGNTVKCHFPFPSISRA